MGRVEGSTEEYLVFTMDFNLCFILDIKSVGSHGVILHWQKFGGFGSVYVIKKVKNSIHPSS